MNKKRWPDWNLFGRRKDALRHVRSRKPAKCPACGARTIARILYGMPDGSLELQRQLDSGLVVLGGCVLTGDDPAWQCTSCATAIWRRPRPRR